MPIVDKVRDYIVDDDDDAPKAETEKLVTNGKTSHKLMGVRTQSENDKKRIRRSNQS